MTVHLYLTDKTGKRFWNTSCGAGYSSGERHNLKAHLARIKAGHPAYAKCEIDRETARLVDEEMDGLDMSPEAIMEWLREDVDFAAATKPA
jgi:hypothetical protein